MKFNRRCSVGLSLCCGRSRVHVSWPEAVMQSVEGETVEQLEASLPAVPDLRLYLVASVCRNERGLFPNMSHTGQRNSPEKDKEESMHLQV